MVKLQDFYKEKTYLTESSESFQASSKGVITSSIQKNQLWRQVPSQFVTSCQHQSTTCMKYLGSLNSAAWISKLMYGMPLRCWIIILHNLMLSSQVCTVNNTLGGIRGKLCRGGSWWPNGKSVHWTLDGWVQNGAQARVALSCSQARHLTLPVPLPSQESKWNWPIVRTTWQKQGVTCDRLESYPERDWQYPQTLHVAETRVKYRHWWAIWLLHTPKGWDRLPALQPVK